ncbi:MAG: aminotransferase class V-fold PLP-dependent enzyme [Bryobacteraceae bacterium]
METRRSFLKAAPTTAILAEGMGSAEQISQPAMRAHPPTEADEAYFLQWYDVDRSMVNLENAYWNVMTRPILEEYWKQTQFLNRVNVPFVRGVKPSPALPSELLKVRSAVAGLIGAEVEEIALTRCGTESLQDLISGYRGLKPGDVVVYCDLDYDAMQNTMVFLKDRRGVQVETFVMPEPATTANILAAYEEMLNKTPRAKLMLVTHLCHRTGLVNPVKEIIAIARRHGVSVVLDSAQAVGQMPVNVREFDADFAGFSLHKWIGAPLGTGAMYIRKDRLDDMDLCLGNREDPPDDIRSRVYAGTYNFAATLTVPRAIAFHNEMTVERKQARLRFLRNYWVSRARDVEGVEILTPDEEGRYGATTSFRLQGMHSFEDAKKLQGVLVSRYNILTVARSGITRGAAVRVTPALYNSTAELDQFVAAVHAEQRMFV